MPVYFTGYLPETIQTGGERFSDQSAWWRAERLNMLISADYNAFSGSVQADIRSLEQRFDTEAAVNETIASRLIAEDHRDQAFVILNNQMDRHTMGGRTALLTQPYEDDSSTCGIPNYTQEELDAQVKLAYDLHIQVGAHVIGDKAAEMLTTAIERARADRPNADFRCFRMAIAGTYIALKTVEQLIEWAMVLHHVWRFSASIRDRIMNSIGGLHMLPQVIGTHVH